MKYLLLLCPLAALSGSSDLLLLSSTEAAQTKKSMTAAAAAQLRKSADRAMKSGPWSVTFHRPQNTPAGLHDFYSEGPY